MPDAPAIAAPVANTPPATTPVAAPVKAAPTPPPSHVIPAKPVVSKAKDYAKELDDLDKSGVENGDGKTTAKAPEKTVSKPEVDDEFDEDGEEVQAKPVEKPAESKPKSVSDFPDNDKFLKSKPLRDAYQNLLTTSKAELGQLREKVRTLESSKPVENPDLPKLTEAIKQRDKELSELRETVKFLRYEESPEYKEKYIQQYEAVASDATNRATQLKVANPDGSGFRTLTKDEFWKIVGTGDENDAVDMAVSIFGENNPRVAQVIERRNEILKEFQRGEQAKKEFRKTVGEREKVESENTLLERQQQNEHSQKVSDTFQTLIKARAEARPEYNKAEEGDSVGERLLNSGTAMADLMFGRLSPDRFEQLPKKVREKLTPDGKLPADEQVKLHSMAYASLRERPFIAYQLKSARAELLKVKEELSQYQESEPDKAGGAQRRPKAASPTNWRQELAALDTPATR